MTVIKLVFTLVGGGMLAGAIALGVSTRQFLASSERAEGTVIDLLPSRSSSGNSVLYSPVFEFRAADGREYEVRSSVASSPPSYDEGEKVTVLYPRDAPQDARIDGFFALWGATAIVGGIGTVFFAIGAGIALAGLGGARKAADLKANGQRVNAELETVERNTSLEVNGEHPWRIIARWKDPATQKYREFRSANLWTDPSAHLADGVVAVYLDPSNPKRYHVDTSYLD